MVFRQSARSSWTWAGGGATLRLELRRFRRGPDGSAGSDRDRSSSTGSPSLRSSRDALNRFLRCCALRSAMKWFMFRGTLRTTAPRSSTNMRSPKAPAAYRISLGSDTQFLRWWTMDRMHAASRLWKRGTWSTDSCLSDSSSLMRSVTGKSESAWESRVFSESR